MNRTWVFVLCVLVGTVPVMACGPYFPSSYVLWSQEEDVLLLPRTSFYRELRGIAGKSASRSFLPKIKMICTRSGI